MTLLQRFMQEEDALGTVELILIIVVLVGLVAIFKKQLVSLVNNILAKITKQSFYVTFYFARPNTFASFANSSKDNASPLTDGENPHSAIAASIVSFSKDNPS